MSARRRRQFRAGNAAYGSGPHDDSRVVEKGLSFRASRCEGEEKPLILPDLQFNSPVPQTPEYHTYIRPRWSKSSVGRLLAARISMLMTPMDYFESFIAYQSAIAICNFRGDCFL